MKNFHFCGQQQTLGSFVLSDVSYRNVWQEEQNKSKENSFTQQRTEFFQNIMFGTTLNFCSATVSQI